jgi:hypothetical protein
MEMGTALHSLILEGRDVLKPIDAPDFRTKAAQEARDDARRLGRIPVLTHKAAEIYKTAKIARSAIQDALKIDLEADGKAEVTLEWQEGTTPCKARLDWLSNDHGLIFDLKTTEVTSPAAFMRSTAANGLDIQSALYRQAVKACYGTLPRFVFAVLELGEFPQVYFVELSQAYQAIGKVKLNHGIQLWTAAEEANIWPSYPTWNYAEPAAWTLAEAEELHYRTEGFDKEAFLFGRVK